MKQCHRRTSRYALVQFCYFSIVSIVLVGSSAAQNVDSNYRLPNNTYPMRYNIELTTKIHDDTVGDDRFRFDGKVTIQLMTSGQLPSNSITVNYRRIDITHVRLWHMVGGWEQIILDDNTSFTLDPVREFLTVQSPQPLNGSYYLELQYNGTLREDNAGFYRSSYRDENGIVRWLATTQFSSTDARHAFPCYDEPGVRAPIGLRIIHGINYTVLSTGVPIDARESLHKGMIITTFADTPRMPAYLLGIVVSDFTEVSLSMYARQKAFSRPMAIPNGEANFIVEAGFKILAALEDFLETPYILPKLYHVAVPDFAPGAMENYGLITYKEENFYYNNISSPMKQRKKIATIVGHEIGHHYFGNYVSPRWWSYLWMKEGFARFFEYVGSQMVYPELEIDETYTVDKTHNVFEMDSFGDVRPMTFYVNTQSEIAKIFDDIAYDKGGAVLRMLYHALGKEVFRRALVHYLEDNALQAAEPDQFAEAMQKANNVSVPPVMYQFSEKMLLDSWTLQAGYPILHVSRAADCSLKVHQEKYLLKTNSSSSGETWIVPYNFATANVPSFENTLPDGWLIGAEQVIFPTAARNWTCSDWIVFNKQQTGYYRVNYDTELWTLIIETLLMNHTVIHRINRAQIMDDALNSARSGRLGYEVPLRLLPYLSNELDYVPWASVDRNLRLLDVLLRSSTSYHLWQRYCLEFVKPIYDRVGIITRPLDTLLERMTREIVVMWACKDGSPLCLSETAAIVEAVAQNLIPEADPDLRESIYCNGLRYASSNVFEAMWKRMQTSTDQAYRSEMIRSLGCVQDGSLLEQFLNSTINVEEASYYGQERDRVLEAVYSNGIVGIRIAIKFFRAHMVQINALYNKGNFGGRAISTAIRRMAKQTANEEIHVEFQDLMEQLLVEGLLQSSDMLQALAQSSENIMWINTKGKSIESWLADQYTTTTPLTTSTTEPATTARSTNTPSTSSSSTASKTVVSTSSSNALSSIIVDTTIASSIPSSSHTPTSGLTLPLTFTSSTEPSEMDNESAGSRVSCFLTIILTALATSLVIRL